MRYRLVLLLLTAVLLLSVACVPKLDRKVRTGDLMFVGIPADYNLDEDSMGSAISDATGKGELNIIHVAILEVEGDSLFVIDATIKHGVDRHPIDTFFRDFTLKDGSLPVLEVRRIEDARLAQEGVDRAKKCVGLPYDVHFLPDNGAYYCSELVCDNYLDTDGRPIFHMTPMNFKDKDGNMPVYWEQLFALLGEPVPQGQPGTSPQGLREERALHPVPVDLVSLCP